MNCHRVEKKYILSHSANTFFVTQPQSCFFSNPAVKRKVGDEHRQFQEEEEDVDEAIALHCIIHQQALCSKCLKFDSVMSNVVKCINHIRSRGLKHR